MRGTIQRLAGGVSLMALIFVASLATSPSFAERLTYTYDDLDRLDSLTYEDGSKILYTYDAAGNRLTQNILGNHPTNTH